MAKRTFRQRIVAGLVKLGYVKRDTIRGIRAEYSPGAGARALFEGTHRIVLGSRTSVRYTRTTLAESRPLAQNLIDRILEAEQADAT